MKGTNYLLAITTTTDEVTNEVKPLFAFPIQMCKGTDDASVKFDIAAPSGAPREQVYRDTATGDIVADDECLRGVRVTETDFREIDRDAISQIDAEQKITTIVAQGKVELAGLREKYGDRITGRYYVQSPAKMGSPKAYRLTYEALRGDKKRKPLAIIVKRTKTSKQALGWIFADEQQQALVFVECIFATQVRAADEQVQQPQTVEIDKAQIDMARQVIESLPDGTLALDNEIDDAQALKRALIEAAINGDEIVKPKPVAATVESDDLQAALLASLTAA